MADIVIVGGGIGGLAAAHAVRQSGHNALILERAPSVTAIGAGLVLWPNAVRAMDSLGLGQDLRAIAATAGATEIRSIDGSVLSRMATDALVKRAGAPMLLVERPALHELLVRDLDVRCDRPVARAEQGAVVLEGGERMAADAVIGADGIGSIVRGAVAPEAAIKETGMTAVRSVAPVNLGAGLVFEIWGAGELCGAAGLPGGRTYWFFETASERVDANDPLATIAPSRWPDPIARLAEATEPSALLVHPVRTLSRLKTWTRGRIALLGDAAHAMTPNLGQGAAQALEDAAELADALTAHADLVEALQRYEAARVRRARMIQRESTRISRLALSRRAGVRDSVMRAIPAGVRLRAMLRLVG
jgi:2-polyprenyl-6-methoxyphenol hydroxylase-like FAD-dependent oxidoreductase